MNEFENELVDKIEGLSPTLQSAFKKVIDEIDQLHDQSLNSAQFNDGVVDCICRIFNLYSVNLYLIEPKREWVILIAGTSEMSRAAIQYGHKLPLAGNSLVGMVIR